jgi:CheY-like chemotaxis protein
MNNTILVFDDDGDMLELCKIIFEKLNYRLETRARSENILADLKQVQPNLILMDLRIPEIGGEKAIELYKNNPATADIPVILFSANPEIEKIASSVRANGFLKKPFDIAELLFMVQNHLKVEHL